MPVVLPVRNWRTTSLLQVRRISSPMTLRLCTWNVGARAGLPWRAATGQTLTIPTAPAHGTGRYKTHETSSRSIIEHDALAHMAHAYS
jgi:hypothetical protein